MRRTWLFARAGGAENVDMAQLAARGEEATLRVEADGPGLDGARVDCRPQEALRLEVPHA